MNELDLLRGSGIQHPLRLRALIEGAVERLELDLRGTNVLTEAATGPYAVTPVIAACAGADVVAFTASSPWGSVEDVRAQLAALCRICGVDPGRIRIATERERQAFADADIVTNLGFVRPLDAATIELMRAGSIVSLMCEAWEFRPGDLDLDACRQAGVGVVATNEDHPLVDVFRYSGWLAMKLLFDAQVEIHQARITIVSPDKFGDVIAERLAAAGAATTRLRSLKELAISDIERCDALLVADYTSPGLLIGPGGELEATTLAAANPALTVVQFAGRIDAGSLAALGLNVQPPRSLPSHRMASTLAALGPRPVVDLHAAGLKAAALGGRKNGPESFRSLYEWMVPVP